MCVKKSMFVKLKSQIGIHEKKKFNIITKLKIIFTIALYIYYMNLNSLPF